MLPPRSLTPALDTHKTTSANTLPLFHLLGMTSPLGHTSLIVTPLGHIPWPHLPHCHTPLATPPSLPHPYHSYASLIATPAPPLRCVVDSPVPVLPTTATRRTNLSSKRTGLAGNGSLGLVRRAVTLHQHTVSASPYLGTVYWLGSTRGAGW